MTILDKIIAHKKIEVEVLKEKFWKNQKDKEVYISQVKQSEISFSEALKMDSRFHGNDNKSWPKLIAEVKKGSPSQGLIRADFEVAEIVKLYDKYAAAMSILTDEKFFLGSLDNLKIARNNSNKPLLRKDFIIDEFQIFEARKAGANAILLLASVLNTEQIQEFLDLTHSLGMDALVEVHDEVELENVLKTDAKIIGINNRNLKDFSVDLDNSNRLAQLIPKDKIIVSESGINAVSDIRKVRQNADAILVGTAIAKQKNMEEKLREIVGIPKVKICGITNFEDAQAAIKMGANYLGFIFYEKSPRNISPEKCAKIIKKLKETFWRSLSRKSGRQEGVVDNEMQDSGQARKTLPRLVGVFVNKKVEQVLKVVQECSLDVVQLHGDEDEEFVESLKIKVLNSKSQTPQPPFQGGVATKLPTTNFVEIWKALRIKEKEDLEQIKNFPNVHGILLDTFHKDNYGGTGETFNWEILDDFYPEQKIVLAGGLDSSNVKQAIDLFHPDILDVSSRIEERPGEKDLGKMQKLFDEISRMTF